MENREIQKLNQLISRTDMSGNKKVEWLKNFIKEREQQLRLQNVSDVVRDFEEWQEKYPLVNLEEPDWQIKRFLSEYSRKRNYVEDSSLVTHPEDNCQQCGGRNPTWSAPNDLWNEIMGIPYGILCPACFEDEADKAGFKLIFGVESATNINTVEGAEEYLKSEGVDVNRFVKKGLAQIQKLRDNRKT